MRILTAIVTVVVFLLGGARAEAFQLRICEDQNNLPFSKIDGSGFENQIAEIVADELGAQIQYTWHAQRRGFVRTTLRAGLCDVVMGIPSSTHILRTTAPYYRSSYAFVQRANRPPITSFDDPSLRKLKIGVQLIGDDGINTPPVHDLTRRGIVSNVHGYLVQNDYREPTPLSPIVKAVANGDVDVAVVWGPIAGYFAAKQSVPLTVTPVLFDPTSLDLALTYDISMGVRKGDMHLLDELNRAIAARKTEIDAVLDRFNVPRVAVN